MNYLVSLLISEIRQQYEAMAIEPTEQIMARLAEMSARATIQLNLCMVLGSIGLILSIVVLVAHLRNIRRGGRHC